ncbi:MAG: FecR family protein [Blastocatellia bacterium]
MQKIVSRFVALSFALLLIASVAQAQYLVSSKAGFVNRVEGKVHLHGQGSAPDDMHAASMASQMKEGNQISTDANSHAELLLTPGSYLRLNEKTTVEAVRTSLEGSRFDIVQGSVIVEIGEIDKKSAIEIGTPRGVVTMNRAGIYRIDVVGKDVAVSVRKGEAYIGTRDQLLTNNVIKIGGNRVYRLVGDGAPQTAKLSAKVFDEFDQWSYLRAESLVAANYSLLQRTRSRNALLSGWIYDPMMNSYTFVPSSWLFVTPYGFGFYRRYSDCDWCFGGYLNPYYYNGGYYGNGSNNGGGGGSTNVGSGGAPPRVTDESRLANRTHTQRDTPSRQVEPYSRPTVFYPTDRGASSRGIDSQSSVYSPSSRSTSSFPSSSPSSAPASSVPSRVDTSSPASSDRGGGGGRGDSSRGTSGPRGN